MKNQHGARPEKGVSHGMVPRPCITKLAIVSRDYRNRYENGYRDFSHMLPRVLEFADGRACNAVLFSLFTIIPRKPYDPYSFLRGLKNIKTVFIEEFQDGIQRKSDRFVIYHLSKEGWREYEIFQAFATLTGMTRTKILTFVDEEIPRRILGNCCVLLCGETNGVKYIPKHKRVEDTFGLRSAIPYEANVILNPIHNRMTRFEMKLKRKFLSENCRWVVSVWNKGKEDKNRKVKDGGRPAWTVYHDGKEIEIDPIHNDSDIEIGILDL